MIAPLKSSGSIKVRAEASTERSASIFLLWLLAALSLVWLVLSYTPFYPVAFHHIVAFTGPPQLDWVRGTLLAISIGFGIASVSRQLRTFLLSPIGLAVLPFLALTFVVTYRSQFGAFDSLYAIVIFEDGPVEFLSCILFGAASLLFVSAAVKLCHLVGAGLLLLALFAAFVAGEEISWGQRIFGWETPDGLADANMQKETNIHNIAGLELIARHLGPFLIAAYGVLGWIPRNIILALARHHDERLAPFNLLFPPAYVFGYFLPLAVFSVVKWYQPESFWFAFRDEELWELFLATGFTIYAWDCRNSSHLKLKTTESL